MAACGRFDAVGKSGKKHVNWSKDLTASDPTGEPDAPGRENQ
jgi:hypothetical protein